MMLLGSALAAAAIEIFLVPNDIIDGGIVGVSLMASHLSGIPLGVLTFALNVPFLFIGYKQIGRTFLISALFAIISFSVLLSLLRDVYVVTLDTTLASLFGGVVLGAGVGLVIRFGGSLDGTEMVSIIISRSTSISVGQCVMLFNIVILGSASFVFGWDKALYSMLTYFVASKVMDIVVEGLDEAKCVMIVSDRFEELAEAITQSLGRGVTFLDGEGSYLRRRTKIIYVVVTRIEISKLKNIISDTDPGAFLTVSNVADVMGGSHKK
jgi:uncharacterized membrane-anchored protein YitT (DUF2179 family)